MLQPEMTAVGAALGQPSLRGGGIGLPSPYNPGVRFWELDKLRVAAHEPQVLRSDEDANRVVALVPPQGL